MAHNTIDDIESGALSDDPHSPPGLTVHTEVCPMGKLRTTAIGELDAATRAQLEDHLAALPLQCHTLDLRFVSFIDAGGCAVIANAVANGVDKIIASPVVERVLRMCDLADSVDPEPVSLRGHLHCASFGVAIYDDDLRFVYVNDVMADIHGLPADVHVGYRAIDLLGATDTMVDMILARVLRTGQAERRVINAEVDGERGVFDCYFGPADLNNRRGVISTVRRVHVETDPTTIDLRLNPPAMPHALNPNPSDDDPLLTWRERQVLDALAEGYTNREIADQLSLSIDTVKTYCRRIFRKLGVENRTQAAVVAHRRRA